MNTRRPGLLERMALAATCWTGTSLAFALALFCVIAWAATGPLFDYSDTWQLVINTSTTVVTFLMVFLIQRSQNKESQAVQLKLNELIAAVEGASARLINVEDLAEDDIRKLHLHYGRLAELAGQNGGLRHSHSIEEAERRHRSKKRSRGRKRSRGAKETGRG
jgi:low affinity Fe/Cu permease